MQGEEFQFDLQVMDIRTYDLVLGLQWLQQVAHHASWNYDDLAMTFWYNRAMCNLKLTPRHGCKLVRCLDNHVEEGSQLFLLQAIEKPRHSGCVLNHSSSEPGARVCELPREFGNVFFEPRSLLPLREGHNHPIVLQEGTDRVNLRPYHYLAMQKDEIERQVKGLLENGVIQESSSPFACPIVLVKKKDGTWRMCIDCQELNKWKVKNKYPILLVEELLDEL